MCYLAYFIYTSRGQIAVMLYAHAATTSGKIDYGSDNTCVYTLAIAGHYLISADGGQ